MVFHLALNTAGIAAQSAPAAMLLTAMQAITAQLGSVSPRQIMQAADARAPIRACPSPPIFQKRILNAGVTARETHSSMAMFCSSTQNLRGVPKEPLKMAAYT